MEKSDDLLVSGRNSINGKKKHCCFRIACFNQWRILTLQLSDNAIHEFATEYFTIGNDETDDDVSSDEDEMHMFWEIKLIVIQHSLLLHIDWMNTASPSAAMNSSEAVDEGMLYHRTLTFT